jgi:hypothetical protein
LKLCKDKPADKPPATTQTPATTTQPPATTTVAPKPIDKPAVTTQPPPETKPIETKSPAGDHQGRPDVAQASPPEEPVDNPEPTTSGGGLRKIGIGVGIAGVVLGGVGVYFALDSGKAASDLDGYMGPWGQEQIDLEARGERSAKLGWVFGIGGAAAVVAGGVMFAIGGPKAVESSSVSVIPTKGGGQLTWSQRF